jgi:hypothetical protein
MLGYDANMRPVIVADADFQRDTIDIDPRERKDRQERDDRNHIQFLPQRGPLHRGMF